MFCLLIESRFAAFRPFITGNLRPTAPFITPSSAYGLLLNLARIEMRQDDGKSEMTLIKKSGLPEMDIALGAPVNCKAWKWGQSLEEGESSVFPAMQQLYQQLHNYPVGKQGKEHAPHTKGNKYNITPVHRSFLSGLRAVACFRNYQPDDIGERARNGLRGEIKRGYGLPFLGDSNFLPDRIEILESPPPCRWFVPVVAGEGQPPHQRVGRLTITIDRADSSRTRSGLFGPSPEETDAIPEAAWVPVNYSHG